MDAQVAPEFPDSIEWLNLAGPLRMSQLRGKVCALAFVNAGSAWSIQRLKDLVTLLGRHREGLNVVAVHVPRFEHEREGRRVAKRLRRYGFDFPLGHDPDWTLWQHYDVQAWPTVVLVDGDGMVSGRVVGDGPLRELDAQVADLVRALVPQSINPEPIELRRGGEPPLPLRFPMGLALAGNYLYVADSAHHRVLECDQSGRILRQFGSGGVGFIDGPMELAAFNQPQGIAVERDLLYVADAGNHAVRRVQLRTGDIDTVLGAGRPGTPADGTVANPRDTVMDRPTGVALAAGCLYVCSSGDNRVWAYGLGDHSLRCLAGSGRLEVTDGAGADAAFAEPTGLAAVQQTVYVCDAAGSAVRSVNARSGLVQTVMGSSAWEFGSQDGRRSEARLQQPQAIALDPDSPRLWIADSGNDLLRCLRLGGGEVSTFALPRPLHGPAGLAVGSGVVWIADTDAHAVLRLDTSTGDLHHIPLGE